MLERDDVVDIYKRVDAFHGVVLKNAFEKVFNRASCALFRFEKSVRIAPYADDVVFCDVAVGQVQLSHAVGGHE